jgi:hypothetical protein
MLFFPDCSTVIRGSPRLVIGTQRCCQVSPWRSQASRRFSQVHPTFTPALIGGPKPITITAIAFLFLSSDIPVTMKAKRNALPGCHSLLKLTHQSLHSSSSQTLLEAWSDYNGFCLWLTMICEQRFSHQAAGSSSDVNSSC